MATQFAPRISVIFGSYNQLDSLKLVLAHYETQTVSEDAFEVIVVDSSSSDGTQEFLQSYVPNYHFRGIIQPNQGKVAARHRAIIEAKGDYILVTDSDMIPDQHFVDTHLRAQESSSTAMCFEGVTMNLDTLHWPPQDSLISPYIQRNYADRARLGWYYFLTGNISFPKETYFDHGGFDHDFKGYGWEDLELGYRFSKSKIPLLYLKSAVNYHYHVITEWEEVERNIQKGKSARTFYQKHPNLKWFLGMNPLSCFLFPKISYKGPFYSYIYDRCFHSKRPILHRFGLWFLKEYFYMQAVLNTDQLNLMEHT